MHSFARAWTHSPKKKLQLGGGYGKSEAEGKGGTLTVTASVSNGASRYAMPTIPELVYAALLYKDGESPENPLPEKFVKGEPNSDKFVFSFQRPDETEGLTLEVFAFKDDTTDFSKDNALLSGKKTGLKVNGDKIEVVETIALSVYEKSEEKGTVSLQIKVPADCTLEIKELKADGTTENDPHFAITDTAQNFTITQNGTGISAGAYKVIFSVKKGDEIIHIFTESINVLPGMCTDTWWNGATPSATKEITQDMVSTIVYVRGKDTLWYASNAPNATADDKNSGSFLAPLATIQKAVDTIIARNDGTSEYTICIDGTLDGMTAAYLGEKGMADFSALAQDLKLTIKALSGTATLDGGAVFNADGTVGTEGIKKRIICANPGTNGALNLTLENLVITGGNTIGGNGGGIYFNGKTLEMTGCDVVGCEANNGGGVYVNDGTFTMTGGTISNCTSAIHGGGIYIKSDGGTIKNCIIRGNTATGHGGGIYFSANEDAYQLTIEDSIVGGENLEDGNVAQYGGGVYVLKGKLVMKGGSISKNTATNGFGGGGVYVYGTFTMEGGTISGNTTNSSGNGAYILPSGELNMSGAAQFIGDNDVYLSENSSTASKIRVTGELTATTTVATITLPDYRENRLLLSAGVNVTLSGAICNKFAVTPQNDGTEWRVALDGTDGVLIRKYGIGETGSGGGTVFYYSADGFVENGKTCHYLEVSKESLGSMTWCPCYSCDVSTSNEIGAGYANTQAILAHANHTSATASNCAAKACVGYSTDTTTAGEWFLPSYEEATKIYRGCITTSEETLWYSLSGSDNNIAGYVTVRSNGWGGGGKQKATFCLFGQCGHFSRTSALKKLFGFTYKQGGCIGNKVSSYL